MTEILINFTLCGILFFVVIAICTIGVSIYHRIEGRKLEHRVQQVFEGRQ